MEKKAAVNTTSLNPSLENIAADLRNFIEMSLQQDDPIREDWFASFGGDVEIRCWEKKNCGETNCPAYENESGRCWLVAGSLCGSSRGHGSRPGPVNCCDCEIYRDYVGKDPVSEMREQVVILIHNLRARQLEVQEMAARDPLTGLKNRRFFDMYIKHELERVNRSHESMAILVFNIDGFKDINAFRGHDFGNKILKECAGILEKTIRGTDLLFRFEEDEFLIVMNKAGDREAGILIKRINDNFAAWNSKHEEDGLLLSISTGFSALTHSRELFEVMSEAELRMYEDKKRPKEDMAAA